MPIKKIIKQRKKVNKIYANLEYMYNEEAFIDEETKSLAQEDFLTYLQIDANQSRLYSQHILWISAGAVALTMSTINSLMPFYKSIWPILIPIAMVFFFITIIITFWSLHLSSIQYHSRLNALDAKRKFGEYDCEAEIEELKCIQISKKLPCYRISSFSTFILGFLSLFIFIFKNFDLIVMCTSKK